MKQKLVIALDAMGGDDAPNIVVSGAEIARKKYPNAHFLFFGNDVQISPLLNKFPKLKLVSKVRHTDEMIQSDDKPSHALRRGRQSSMRLAINAVADGEADCIISAGNTGALMAMAKFVLRVLPGVTRPAIASYYPTMKKNHAGTVLLDLGANIICTAQNLVEFSILGAVFSREILKIEKPRIGILNVGEEEGKGIEQVKEASQILLNHKTDSYDYIGFVEGNDITNGSVDVVATDGFTGNITLKATEGFAKAISYMAKDAIKNSILAWVGIIFMLPALLKLKKTLDPRRYNGGVFLGLRGLCVKSHGGTDGFGFSNAISVGAEMVLSDFNKKLEQELKNMTENVEATK